MNAITFMKIKSRAAQTSAGRRQLETLQLDQILGHRALENHLLYDSFDALGIFTPARQNKLFGANH